MAYTPPPAPKGQPADRQEVIRNLEAQLGRTSRSQKPYEYATIAYRLGLAYAESTGTQTDGLRKALAYFDVAAAIYDPKFDPVLHARVINAAGSVHRALGNRTKAAALFEQSIGLLEGKDKDPEMAANLNNLGLVRSELGEFDAAVKAFDAAVDLFDSTTPDGRRGRIATLLNRGQAHAAQGTVDGLEAALVDYEEAQSEIDMEEAPYHFALVQHSMGVAFSALAPHKPDERERLLQEAVAAFSESLSVFTRSTFPFQFSLAKHNMGLAYASMGGAANLRRALCAFEDTVSMLDVRVHSDQWRQAYASLERVENELKVTFPGLTRTEHFAHLLASVKPDERHALVRERLFHLMALPDPRRIESLAELGFAIAKLGPEKARPIFENALLIIIELPQDRQELGLRGLYEGTRALPDEETRLAADTALDYAIGDALGGPQRVFVRDFLESLGWERP